MGLGVLAKKKKKNLKITDQPEAGGQDSDGDLVSEVSTRAPALVFHGLNFK